MKFKTTQKAIREGYRNILEVGYCDLQYLLYYENPIAYTSGVYGWNSDIYQINNSTVIVTGYRPFGNKRIDYKLIREYDEKAMEIIHNLKAENTREKVDELLEEFINKIMKEEN